MQSHRFSPYEYLTFIFPGITLLATLVYGWEGWPYGEPGLASFLGIVAAGFVTGHLVTALANWLEPVYWRDRPGQRVSSVKGLTGGGALYNEEEWKRVQEVLADLHPQLNNLENQFRVEYSLALKGPLGARLQTFVDQIGFYRAMATASAGSLVAVSAFAISGREHLPAPLWIPIFFVATLAFAARYRRFWTRLGDYVIREAISRKESGVTEQSTGSVDN